MLMKNHFRQRLLISRMNYATNTSGALSPFVTEMEQRQVYDESATSSLTPAVPTSSKLSTTSVINIAIGLLGVVGNLFACLVIAYHQSLRKRLSGFFIVNQSLLDLVIGLVLVVHFALKFDRASVGPGF